MKNNNCNDCKHWEIQPSIRSGDGAPLGQCRNHSPVAIELHEKPRTRWPVTRTDDYCGDHKMKEKAA